MSLAAKLLTAQIAVDVAVKSARNDHHRFNYATADSVVAVAKEALNASGLVLVNTKWEIRGEPIAFSVGERDNQISGLTVAASFILLDSESEEKMELSCELPYVPVKGRPVDKAALASLTEMRGYLALGLLGIERVDKDDVSGRDDTSPPSHDNRSQQQQQRQQQQQQSDDREYDDEDPNVCKDCGSDDMRPSRKGGTYCHPCYVAYSERHKTANGNSRRY